MSKPDRQGPRFLMALVLIYLIAMGLWAVFGDHRGRDWEEGEEPYCLGPPTQTC